MEAGSLKAISPGKYQDAGKAAFPLETLGERIHSLLLPASGISWRVSRISASV